MGNAAPSKTTTYRKRVIVISSLQSKFWLLPVKEQLKACLEAPSDSWLKKASKSLLAADRKGDDLLDAELLLGVQMLPFEDFVNLLRGRVLERCQPVGSPGCFFKIPEPLQRKSFRAWSENVMFGDV